MIELSELTSDEYVHCPSCGDECGLHIGAIVVNAGGQITKINRSGLHHYTGDPDGRGTSITVTYGCEFCAEVTSVKQHFNKGTVLLSSKRVGSCSFAGPEDIWRD